ncbi:hypothetical protein VM1G_08569 [Cytospora mali]|uniref:Uncharacterized protein n=1 Tax=Cytospora mali TaxID=578113 RepID=A0A194W815_CYTMA|nr:hypothetical protein VM1G_08569 [Valsa mali]
MVSLRSTLLHASLLLSTAVQADQRTCYYPNAPYDDTGATIGIIKEILGSWSSYCCGTPEVDGNDLVCPNNLSAFTIEHGDMIYGYAGLVNATDLSSASSSTSSSAASSATGDMAITVSSVAPFQSGATTATSSSSGSPDGSNSGNSNTTTAVGAGVGVSLGAALAGALAWGFWERRKRYQERQSAGGTPGLGTADGKLSGYMGYYNISQTHYSPQPLYQPQQHQQPYPAQAAHMQSQAVPTELPNQNLNAVELMDNSRQ